MHIYFDHNNFIITPSLLKAEHSATWKEDCASQTDPFCKYKSI